jgi:hypothetical protein
VYLLANKLRREVGKLVDESQNVYVEWVWGGGGGGGVFGG